MIVDAHSHIRLPVKGLSENRVNIYGVSDNDVGEYLRAYESNGIEACFVFGAESFRQDSVARAENEALATLIHDYPGRFYPWATVNPAWPEKKLREEIQYALGELGLYGLKFVPICQGVSLANRGFDIIAEECIAFDKPFTTHDGSPEYCSAIQVAYYARKYPELRVVSAHGGLREFWPDLIDATKELPNLYICLSGPTQLGIQTLYDELGPSKLMFGSDGGIGPAAVTTAYLRRIARLNAPDEDKQLILCDTAMCFLLGDDWDA